MKHWYMPLILGIIYILIGIWVFLTPAASYLALALLFAIMFIVTGILEIIYAAANKESLEQWGWLLAAGIIELMVGILLLSHPDISLLVLPLFVSIVILFRSGDAIAWSIELKRQDVSNWGWVLALGILGLILAFLMILNPVFAGLTIVFYTAVALIVIGIFRVHLAFRLK